MQITGQKKKQQRSAAPKAPVEATAATATTAEAAAPLLPPATSAPPTYPTGRPLYLSAGGVPVQRDFESQPAPLPAPAAPFTTEACLAALAARMAAGQLTDDLRAPYKPVTHPSTGEGNVKFMEPELAAAASIPVAALASAKGSAHLRAILDTLGFAIVTGILDDGECGRVEQLFAQDLTSVIDVEKSANRAKIANIIADPVHRWPLHELALGAKSVSDWGLPHGRSAWFCRGHPNVKATFASLFGTEEICVGMDCLFYDPTPGFPGCNDAVQSRLWPHADQNAAIHPSGKFEEYQGVLYIWPTDPDTSATVVWPRSHVTVYDGLMSRGRFRRHFCMLAKNEFEDFALNARRVAVPAGAMLLWNSRTVHQGWNGGARLAFPICYEPTERRDHSALQRKIDCVMNGIPTTHWASLGEAHVLAQSAGDTGGDVSLKHEAHLWCKDERGRLRPEIFNLL